MSEKQFEELTRGIFHELHKGQANDESIYKRLTSLLTTEYLKVDDDFFYNKICLDAGCGSNANATFSMLTMGAKKVFAIDLNETIFELTPKLLKEFNQERYELRTGSVLNIDFPDNFFDFVHCGGVLHHSANPMKGLRELARVTKHDGILYIHIYGSGGLLREFTSFLRDKYQNDSEFKLLVDNLDSVKLREWIAATLRNMELHGDHLVKMISKLDFNILIDDDLVLTIKDRITAPVYFEHTEEQLRECLEEEGFGDIIRLTRYPKFNNIRRFLSPLYYEYNSELAKILFGSGYIQLKAKKI